MVKKYADYCWRHMSDRCKPRRYCPKCGQVQCAQPAFGTQHWRVGFHDTFEDGQRVNCPGGPVELEKDKAP